MAQLLAQIFYLSCYDVFEGIPGESGPTQQHQSTFLYSTQFSPSFKSRVKQANTYIERKQF